MARKTHDDLVDDIYTKYESSLSATYNWRREARKAHNYYENSQRPPGIGQEDVLYLTLNMVRNRIDTKHGILTSARPKAEITGREIQDADSAGGLKDVFEFSSKKDKAEAKFSIGVMDCLKAGLGVIKEYLDPDIKQLTRHGWGFGDVAMKNVDATTVYPDPSNRNAEMEGEDGPQWVIEETYESRDLLQQIYKKHKKKLMDVTKVNPARVSKADTPSYDYGVSEDGESVDDSADEHRGPQDESTELLRVLTMWYFEPRVIQFVFQKNKEGFLDIATNPVTKRAMNEEEYDDLPAAMKGDYELRAHTENEVRERAVADKVLLYDRESPYRHKKLPYTFICGNMHHQKPVPYGEIHNLFDAQDLYNKLNSVIIDNAIRTNNSGLIYEEGAMDDEAEADLEKYGSTPGHNIKVRPGSINKIKDRAAGRLPDALFRIQDAVRVMFDELSGIFQVQRGGMPYETSGKAVIALQQAGDVALKGQQERIISALNDWARKRLSNIQQFYAIERSWRISNQVEEYDSYLMTQFDDNGNDETPLALFRLNDGNPEPQKLMSDFTAAEYDIEFSIGTGHERSREQKLEEAQFLFQADAVDREYLLQEFGVEGRGAITKRMDEQNEVMKMGQEYMEMEQDPMMVQLHQIMREDPQGLLQAYENNPAMNAPGVAPPPEVGGMSPPIPGMA